MKLSESHLDMLKELINIGVGRAAGVLNEMVTAHIRLDVPEIRMVRAPELSEALGMLGEGSMTSVRIDFEGTVLGSAALVMPPTSAVNLVSVLTGEEPGSQDIDLVMAGTLTEVGNIIINGVMGSMVNILQQQLHFSLPNFSENFFEDLSSCHQRGEETVVLLALTRLSIHAFEVTTNVVLMFQTETFEVLLRLLDETTARVGGQG